MPLRRFRAGFILCMLLAALAPGSAGNTQVPQGEMPYLDSNMIAALKEETARHLR